MKWNHIKGILFCFFSFLHSSSFGFWVFFLSLMLFRAVLAIRRRTRRGEEDAQETGCEQSRGTATPGALQGTSHALGTLEAPLLMRMQTHSTKWHFPSSLDSDVPVSRFKEGSAHSQPCRPDRVLPPLPEQLSSHLCAPADHKGQLKMHIPKGQEWNLLCWTEIWYLLCSWGWRATSLNSFFQVSPLKLLQILALCFYKWVWKQFFGRKCPQI